MSKLGSLLAAASLLFLVACGSASGDDPRPADGAPPGTGNGAGPDAVAAAEAFAEFATSGRPGDDVPWGDVVRFSIAGEQVALLGPGFVERRASWVRCPGGTTEYEGRACPVSALLPLWSLAEHDHDVVVETTQPRTVGCHRYAGPGVTAAATAWLRPPEGGSSRDCFSDVAVAVVVDDASRIVAVDLSLSGP